VWCDRACQCKVFKLSPNVSRIAVPRSFTRSISVVELICVFVVQYLRLRRGLLVLGRDSLNSVTAVLGSIQATGSSTVGGLEG
jgi:hypothetical protein